MRRLPSSCDRQFLAGCRFYRSAPFAVQIYWFAGQCSWSYQMKLAFTTGATYDLLCFCSAFRKSHSQIADRRWYVLCLYPSPPPPSLATSSPIYLQWLRCLSWTVLFLNCGVFSHLIFHLIFFHSFCACFWFGKLLLVVIVIVTSSPGLTRARR